MSNWKNVFKVWHSDPGFLYIEKMKNKIPIFFTQKYTLGLNYKSDQGIGIISDTKKNFIKSNVLFHSLSLIKKKIINIKIHIIYLNFLI